MFTVSKILKKPQKFTFDQHDINESEKKYNKLLYKINEDIKKKQDIQKILYSNELSKTTNHSVNDLINNSKYYNFIFIVSFISLGVSGLIFYKSR
jgi:uncharacterized protein YabN with tetrapyrrole methylase and pyrophosphatase domain